MKKNLFHINKNLDLKWKLDLERPVISENFTERNWKKVENNNFNIYWVSVKLIKQIFDPKSLKKLKKNQIINHFPNHYELSRKDLLIRNIQKFKPNGKKLKLINGKIIILTNNIIPYTYIIPSDYGLFYKTFRENEINKWIFKPAGLAQGKGIKLVTSLKDLKELPKSMRSIEKRYKRQNHKYVISRYIDNPLLIHNRKFDLRTYILVTNYKPLIVWKYKKGFARFCFKDYEYINSENSEENNRNLISHLTNVSFQKKSDTFIDSHCGKFPLQNFWNFLDLNFGKKKRQKLILDMIQIYMSTLKSVQKKMVNDFHCFELYGFDILIDDNFKPWLLEVNASPSMVTTNDYDFRLKKNLVNDTLNILFWKNWGKDNDFKLWRCDKKKMGDFDLIYDEKKDCFEEGFVDFSD